MKYQPPIKAFDIAFRATDKPGRQYYYIQASRMSFGPYVKFVKRISYTDESKSEDLKNVIQQVENLNKYGWQI